MKKQINGLILVLMLITSNTLYAKQWYQIELIVFAQDANNTEVFEQTESSLRWPGLLTELSRNQYAMASLLQKPVNYARLKSEDRDLNNEYSQLRSRRRYRPLLHEAWIQAIDANSKGRPVRLFKKGQRTVNGYVRLERGHYLHLNVNLEYSSGGLVYPLKQRRRLRFNELHYLDHPKFGVVTVVKRLNL